MTCNHLIDRSRYVEVEHPITGEIEVEWDERKEYTFVDMDVGRFKCTQCGEVQYYTGSWKKFFEEGVPCPGSDLCFPNGPPRDSPAYKKLHG